MSSAYINQLFAHPEDSRNTLIDRCHWQDTAIPKRGSSFFIHLSELCPVGCTHCMYASDMTRKSSKSSLDSMEMIRAIEFINESRSEKLNITGGGEPFLKLTSILDLLSHVSTPRIEIVTAGYWARSPKATDRMLTRLATALAQNPSHPELMLRLSLDRFHINAPHPVPIEYYCNVAEQWDIDPRGMQIGYRSIQPDRDKLDVQLAAKLQTHLEDINDWNRAIRTSSGRMIPITYNVFRRSGKAKDLPEGVELRQLGQTIREYYEPFETGNAKLSLATTVNDAIRGSYTSAPGVALTLDSDGRFWIFCGTSPDRHQILGSESFQRAIAKFFQDPITRLLVERGIWSLTDLMGQLAPAIHHSAVEKNDVASLVDDLLCTPEIRLAVTLVAARAFALAGTLQIDSSLSRVLATPEDVLVQICASLIRAKP